MTGYKIVTIEYNKKVYDISYKKYLYLISVKKLTGIKILELYFISSDYSKKITLDY